jgi:hypothetical protein
MDRRSHPVPQPSQGYDQVSEARFQHLRFERMEIKRPDDQGEVNP